jgi:hypothetical protein
MKKALTISLLAGVVLYLGFLGCQDDGDDPQRQFPAVADQWEGVILPVMLPSDTGIVTYLPDTVYLELELAADSSFEFSVVDSNGQSMFRNVGGWSVTHADSILLQPDSCYAGPVNSTSGATCTQPLRVVIVSDRELTVNVKNMAPVLALMGVDLNAILQNSSIATIVNGMTFHLYRRQ